MLGHYSYEQLFSLMRSLRFSKSQALELYRRMVFNIVARNDDHAKNFGFVLNAHTQWELAPAFDIAYRYKPGSKWVNLHQLSLNGKRDDFTRKDLLIPAEKFKKEAGAIINEVAETVSQWSTYAQQTEVFPDFAKDMGRRHCLDI